MPRIDINTKKQTTFNKDLKNLWDEYILIQEQLLKRRSAPISINPDSIHIEGHKIHAQVDESVRDRIVDKIFKEQLLLEPDDIHDDSILIKEMVWERLSCTDISSIQKELAACYIQMDDTPSISANVYYGNRIGLPSNLLTLSEIREHDKALRNGHICKGKIEDSVACITTLNVDFDLFYLYIFGEKHYSRLTKEKKGEETTKNVINYKNQYISEDSLREYGQKIGLRLEGYQLFFNITNDRAKEKMQELCEYYDPESKSFVFKRNLNKNESQINNVLTEIQSNITRFIQV